MGILFPDEGCIRHFNLSKKTPEIVIRVNFLLLRWLVDISGLAVHYGKIAYGNPSFESSVFIDILKIWTNFSKGDNAGDDDVHTHFLRETYALEDIQRAHKATQEAILTLI